MAKHKWHRISKTQDAKRKHQTLIAHFSKKNNGHWMSTEIQEIQELISAWNQEKHISQ